MVVPSEGGQSTAGVSAKLSDPSPSRPTTNCLGGGRVAGPVGLFHNRGHGQKRVAGSWDRFRRYGGGARSDHASCRPEGRFHQPCQPRRQRDNGLVWGAPRGAGYEVWTDLTRLLGGEEMWLDIDDALRFHARKVVALLSRAAVDLRKEGMRAELDRAHAYRKKLGDRRFIIPVKIDDVPFDELPPTIGNRTIIEAHANHAAALARVIEILQKDGVPRSSTLSANALFRWQRAFGPEDQTVEGVSDSLISNWFPVSSLPETIHFYAINCP